MALSLNQPMEKRMKAVSCKGFGAAARYEIEADARTPEPAPGELLVRVHGASINPLDWKVHSNVSAVAGLFGLNKRFCIGCDVAGEVVSTGSAVSAYRPGDRVFGMSTNFRSASFAEYAVIAESAVFRAPANISLVEAASLPLAALTAIQSYRAAGLLAGGRLLIVGASGGVGVHAVQIARYMGAHVTAVCSSRNAELVKSLGADEIIDYTRDEFPAKSGSFDVVFDVIGQLAPQSCAAMMKAGGYFISTGNGIPKAMAGVALDQLTSRNRRSSMMLVKASSSDLQRVTAMVEEGRLRPVVDSTYSLAAINEAVARSRSGRAQGKLCIRVSG
jgi:NADPH:quinone reductase-like Zn-dependent oxidoreductase